MRYASLLLVLISSIASAQDAPRNVLFLFSDDQRPDAIRALGNSEIETPNIDRLVERGSTFTRAYCMGSWSPAVCLPSRAMVMTGRSLWRVNQNLDGIPTWPEQMRAAGYTTFGTGKWHNGRPSFARSFSDGGAIFFGGMGDHFALPVHDYDPEGEYPKESARPVDSFTSEDFASACVSFLQQHDLDESFFAYVSFTAPHDPRTPPGEYAEMYDPESLSIPDNFLPEHPFDNGEMTIRDEQLAPWPRTPERIRKELADYYGMITHMDAQIGRILDTLEARGLAENTLVIFASDHGLAIGSHGLLGKQNLYEHSMGTPIVIAGPGIPAGQRFDAFAYLFDLMPTAMDWADVPLPVGVEGKSLVPVMRGEHSRVRSHVYGAYGDVQRSIRDDRYKLIWYPEVEVTQVFDLARDPFEMENVADEAAYTGVRARLEEELVRYQRLYGDPRREEF